MRSEVVKAFFMAEQFSRIVMGRDLGSDELAGLILGERSQLPVAGKNIAVAFLRLGLEAVKWYHPSGGVYMPSAKLFVVPRPFTRQICIGCDWGIAVKEGEPGKDLGDLYESRDCPRVLVSKGIRSEFLEEVRVEGYNVAEEEEIARREVIRTISSL